MIKLLNTTDRHVLNITGKTVREGTFRQRYEHVEGRQSGCEGTKQIHQETSSETLFWEMVFEELCQAG